MGHILKMESLRTELENADRFCMDFAHSDLDLEWDALSMGLGVDIAWFARAEFGELMGLPKSVNVLSAHEAVLFVMDAMDYEAYSKVVDFYWQDFVCFDYAADYMRDVLQPLITYQDQFEGFPVKNRTKTNWDRIIEYWDSKHAQ